nr:transglutaminase family protein [Caldimonas sp.]
EALHDDPAQDALRPARFAEPSTLVGWSDAAHAYAAATFAPGREWLDATTELMQRIYREFDFEPGTTTVTTSVDEVLAQRSGVCQDFAHVMIACLRSHGVPARYVSGYLLTQPPPGQERLLGADVSHAWVAAYSPRHGWVEFDPTNDQLADRRYITLASGADFADVVPLRGVLLGGRDQKMRVAVSVIPRQGMR